MDDYRRFSEEVREATGGIPIQDLRARLIIEESAKRLDRFFKSATGIMQVMARACGHSHLNQFTKDDLTTFDRDMAYLTGFSYGGFTPL